MAQQLSVRLQGFPMWSHGPTALPSLAAVRTTRTSRPPLIATCSPLCRLAKRPANCTPTSKEPSKAAAEPAGPDLALGITLALLAGCLGCPGDTLASKGRRP